MLGWASAAQFSYKVSRKSFVSKFEIRETRPRTHARTHAQSMVTSKASMFMLQKKDSRRQKAPFCQTSFKENSVLEAFI
jgi:hypothetical protein